MNENDSIEMRLMLYKHQSTHLGEMVHNRGGITKKEIDYLSDIEVIITCLALVYPEKYYFFDRCLFEQFCNKVEINLLPNSPLDIEYEYIAETFNNIRNILIGYSSIRRLCKETYDNIDVYNHLLTSIFISFVVQFANSVE